MGRGCEAPSGRDRQSFNDPEERRWLEQLVHPLSDTGLQKPWTPCKTNQRLSDDPVVV